MVLRELNENDEAAFFEGVKEWTGEAPHWYSFCWQPGSELKYTEMLERLRKDVIGEDLPSDRVPHTMLYGFVDDKIIGRVSVRHELNDYLRRRGGHIGYAVAPRFRKKGYATEMVGQALEYCRKLGLPRVMITCAEHNTPSWKIIEHFGGILQDQMWDDEEDELMRRYWVRLDQ